MEDIDIPGSAWNSAYSCLESAVAKLAGETSGTAAVVREDGQLLTWAGEALEPASLGALSAGNMAAGGALLASLNDSGKLSMSLDGRDHSFFLTTIDQGAFLLVQFDNRTSLGLVRLRARKLVEEARPWVLSLLQPAHEKLDVFCDADIDALFSESQMC